MSTITERFTNHGSFKKNSKVIISCNYKKKSFQLLLSESQHLPVWSLQLYG